MALNSDPGRIGGGIAVLALAVLVLFGLSGKPQAETTDYRLGVQDRLRIYVAEWPTLTGEFAVGAGGDVSLPLIGQVPATGLTTSELASAISERLRDKQKLQQSPDTSIDIIAYRPFYILGNVAQPGEYAYRPGMIVLNALSLGGGAYRPEQRSQWDVERIAISSRGELKLNEARRWNLLAEQRRYQAELDGEETLGEAPADAREEYVKALAEQRQIFAADLERHRTALRSLETSIDMRKQEMTALDSQLADIAVKLQSTQAELDKIRELAKRDLAVHRLGPLERSLSDVQREKQDLEIAKLRAQQEINASEHEIAELNEQRRSAALAGKQRVSGDLRDITEQSEISARILDSAASYASDLTRTSQEDEAPQLRFSIVRSTDGGTHEFEADETTRVEPGDIIKVFRVAEPVTTGSLGGQLRGSQ